MVNCHMWVLFLTAVAVSPSSQVSGDAGDIQNVLQELLAPKTSHEHVRNEHDHNLHHDVHHDDHDHETLDLVFKDNKITPPNSLSKPIARIGGKNSGFNDMMCKLGVRCGCGHDAERCGCDDDGERCGCSRNGRPCELDLDHTYDNAILLKHDSDDSKPHNSLLKNKKSAADPTILKLLDDLEESLLIQSNGNQGADTKLRCETGTCEDRRDDENRKDNDNRGDHGRQFGRYVESLLRNLEKKNDEENKAHLRCCQNCARKSYYRNSDDDKAYLRCCKACGKNRLFRSNDRNDDRNVRDRYNDRDRSKNFRDRSFADEIDKAKIFQINDNLDAVVLDVSDVGNVLKILNNGNNYDQGNTVRDYVREIKTELENNPRAPKYQDRLLPPAPTYQQKMKLKHLYRRSGKPVGLYGVPFELDVQGLAQVNP